MTHPYPTLLSPLVRRGFVIRNRMGLSRCYPPFSTGVESPELLRSTVTYVSNLAKNGAATVMLPSTRWTSRDDRPMAGGFPGMPPEMDVDPPGPFEPQEGPPAPGSMSGPDLSIANVKLTYIHMVQAVHDQGALALASLMEVEPSGWTIDEIPAEALGRLTDDFAVRCRQYQKLGLDGCGAGRTSNGPSGNSCCTCGGRSGRRTSGSCWGPGPHRSCWRRRAMTPFCWRRGPSPSCRPSPARRRPTRRSPSTGTAAWARKLWWWATSGGPCGTDTPQGPVCKQKKRAVA